MNGFHLRYKGKGCSSTTSRLPVLSYFVFLLQFLLALYLRRYMYMYRANAQIIHFPRRNRTSVVTFCTVETLSVPLIHMHRGETLGIRSTSSFLARYTKRFSLLPPKKTLFYGFAAGGAISIDLPRERMPLINEIRYPLSSWQARIALNTRVDTK